MTNQIRIRQHAEAITVEPGETILTAALRHNIAFPYSCQSGNCGSCKSRLLDGDVTLLPYSEYALSAQERVDGLILACRAIPSRDSSLAWLGADESVAHPIRELHCRVTKLDAATHDITRLCLQVDSGGPFIFSAGQYAKLTFPGQPPRDFSMANSPGQPELEFHIRHLPGGTASAYVAKALQIGDPVQAAGPYGTAYLRELHTGPILAIAGGSGLAPILAIVQTALAKGMQQPIHLYFGVRDERNVYQEQQLHELVSRFPNFSAEIVLSEPATETARPTGFLHQLVRRRHRDFDSAKAYLAGPPPMVEAATDMLTAGGLSRHDIHADAFYTQAEQDELAALVESAAGQQS